MNHTRQVFGRLNNGRLFPQPAAHFSDREVQEALHARQFFAQAAKELGAPGRVHPAGLPWRFAGEALRRGDVETGRRASRRRCGRAPRTHRASNARPCQSVHPTGPSWAARSKRLLPVAADSTGDDGAVNSFGGLVASFMCWRKLPRKVFANETAQLTGRAAPNAAMDASFAPLAG